MNLHHEDIPAAIIDAALTLKNHAIMHGWGGIFADGCWSLHGIGNIDPYIKRIREVEAERDQWKANHDNQVELKRALMDRPDLGDRAVTVQKITAQLAEQADWILNQKSVGHNLRNILNTAHGKHEAAEAKLKACRETLEQVLTNHHEGAGAFENQIIATLKATAP